MGSDPERVVANSRRTRLTRGSVRHLLGPCFLRKTAISLDPLATPDVLGWSTVEPVRMANPMRMTNVASAVHVTRTLGTGTVGTRSTVGTGTGTRGWRCRGAWLWPSGRRIGMG